MFHFTPTTPSQHTAFVTLAATSHCMLASKGA